jgi:hypothetical protein
MAAPISLSLPQYVDANGTPYNGAVLKAYAAGTTTNILMYTDTGAGTSFTDIALNASGYPEYSGSMVIPHVSENYKLALYADQAAADANTPAIWAIDGLIPLTISGTFVTNDAVSNASTNVLSITHTTTGTPVNGIGVGQSFSVETSNGNTELGMVLETVATDVTIGSEDFDFVIKLMTAGAAAAEVFRVTSLGGLTCTGRLTGSDLDLTGANPEILGGDTDGVLITSANTTALGSITKQYGDTHATKAGDFELLDDAGVVYHYDASGALHDFTGAVTASGLLTATAGITSGGDILSDTDSTDSIGSTGVRWLKGWFDTLQAGTLVAGAGSITDTSGAISFGDENLSTTGTLGAGVATLASSSTVGNLTLANGSITDSSGAITFGNENLVTTGTLGAGVATFAGSVTGTQMVVNVDNPDLVGWVITAGTGTNACAGKFTNTGGNLYVGLDNSAGSRLGGSYAGAFWHEGNYPLLFGTNNTERMRIDSSGNVGINTASPASKLNVVGAGRFDNSAATSVRLHINNSGSNDYASIYADTTSAYKNLVLNPDGGSVLVGTTATPSFAGLAVGSTASGKNISVFSSSNGSNGVISIYQSNGTSEGQLYAGTGNVNFFGTSVVKIVAATAGVQLTSGATSWTSISDERAKDIIEPISNAVQKVSNLRSVIGKYKTDSEGTRRSFLIAQDVQAVFPEAVDTTDEDNLGVRYTETIPLLVAAIKEQQAIIDDLKARIETLEGA